MQENGKKVGISPYIFQRVAMGNCNNYYGPQQPTPIAPYPICIPDTYYRRPQPMLMVVAGKHISSVIVSFFVSPIVVLGFLQFFIYNILLLMGIKHNLSFSLLEFPIKTHGLYEYMDIQFLAFKYYFSLISKSCIQVSLEHSELLLFYCQ